MIEWAWRTSEHVEANWRLRCKFVLAALRERSLSTRLAQLDATSALGMLVAERPETNGFLIWPYQCAAWNAGTRFARIEGHLNALDRIPGLKLAADEKLVLTDLATLSPDTFLTIDRPPWLTREGHLTLSLFKGKFRAFTLSFSLFPSSELEVFIGGLQGRQDENILALYRDLTKDFHGVRPRDLMLEALRLFALSIGARHIYAVAEDYKISRHPYFGKSGPAGLFYDEVWQERGGTRIADTRHELPLGGNWRELEDVAPKKRSMYRRRYQMFDEIQAALPRDLASAERKRFDAQ